MAVKRIFFGLSLMVIFIFPGYSSAQEIMRDLAVTQTEKIPPKENLLPGDYWAFIIGIDKYPFLPQLESAVKDARTVKEVLVEKYNFSPDKVIELYDDKATRGNIIDKLRILAQNIKKDDSLFIYYAGHGQLDPLINTGYWIPIDAELNKVDRYLENSVIRDYIRAINSRHTYLVSDSCFSGTLFAAARTLPMNIDNSDEYVKRMSEKPSRQGLTSGGNEPVTDGAGLFGGHSVFAHFFIKTLRENKQPYLLASSVFENIKIPVVNNSAQTPIYRPLQGSGDEGGEFIFTLKQNVGAGLKQVETGLKPVSTFGSLVINSTPWANVYVDNEPYGVPPVKINKLTGGKHTITVKRDGYKTFSKTLEIEDGKKSVLSVVMEK